MIPTAATESPNSNVIGQGNPRGNPKPPQVCIRKAEKERSLEFIS